MSIQGLLLDFKVLMQMYVDEFQHFLVVIVALIRNQINKACNAIQRIKLSACLYSNLCNEKQTKQSTAGRRPLVFKVKPARFEAHWLEQSKEIKEVKETADGQGNWNFL